MTIWKRVMGQMFNFEDNISLLVLKMNILKKLPLFVKEFFKSDNLEWSYGTKGSILNTI